jgi:hypothetical protein
MDLLQKLKIKRKTFPIRYFLKTTDFLTNKEISQTLLHTIIKKTALIFVVETSENRKTQVHKNWT